MSRVFNLESLKEIHFALIHSYIQYGISVYATTSKYSLDATEKSTQNNFKLKDD